MFYSCLSLLEIKHQYMEARSATIMTVNKQDILLVTPFPPTTAALLEG